MKYLMYNFINELYNNNLITKMLKDIFNYINLEDYNYLFRVSYDENSVIIDIYDNVSTNRFNRYYFIFNELLDSCSNFEKDNVFVTDINVFSASGNDAIYKFAHLFSLDIKEMVEYASTFLDKEFVLILEDIIKKPI